MQQGHLLTSSIANHGITKYHFWLSRNTPCGHIREFLQSHHSQSHFSTACTNKTGALFLGGGVLKQLAESTLCIHLHSIIHNCGQWGLGQPSSLWVCNTALACFSWVYFPLYNTIRAARPDCRSNIEPGRVPWCGAVCWCCAVADDNPALLYLFTQLSQCVVNSVTCSQLWCWAFACSANTKWTSQLWRLGEKWDSGMARHTVNARRPLLMRPWLMLMLSEAK